METIDEQNGLRACAFPMIDREPAREKGKPRDLWLGLELMSSGAGVMADWEWALGSGLDHIMPFLKATGELSQSFPCPAHPPCPCRHSVRETERYGMIAACRCEDWECETFRVEPKDVLIYRLDPHGLAGPIRRALGFVEGGAEPYASVALHQVGIFETVAAPVYLSLASPDTLLREIQKLLGLREGPFLVLTPTGSSWSDEVEAMARPRAGGHISLSSVIEVTEGALRPRTTLAPMLAEFVSRVASLRASGDTLRNIHAEIVTVRKEFGELRGAKQRLEKMQAEGVFKFTQKVDPTSFKILCTILAEGDVAKAGRVLGMADSTIRDRLREWQKGGKEHLAMLDLIRWRKKVGRHESVTLNENVMLGKTNPMEQPQLLSELLDGVLSMTEDNWQDLAQELAEMLKSSVRG